MRKTEHIGFLTKSYEFYYSYLLVCRNSKNLIDNFSVKYFLLSRSIELLLKSWLVYKGTSKTEIKTKISHDLIKAFDKCRELDIDKEMNIDFNKNFIVALKKLNGYYKPKSFEYPETGYKELPAYVQFNEPMKEMLKSIENHYRQRSIEEKATGTNSVNT